MVTMITANNNSNIYEQTKQPHRQTNDTDQPRNSNRDRTRSWLFRPMIIPLFDTVDPRPTSLISCFFLFFLLLLLFFVFVFVFVLFCFFFNQKLVVRAKLATNNMLQVGPLEPVPDVKNLGVPHNTASLFHKDIGRPTD